MQNLALLAQLKSDLRAQKEKFIGQVKGTSGRFGFVMLEDGRELFLAPDEMDKVLPGDRVQVTLEDDPKNKKRQSAVIFSLEESSLSQLMGQVVARGKHLFLQPDHPRLNRWGFIPPNQKIAVNPGDYVSTQVSEHPFKKGRFQVSITQVIGTDETRGIESLFCLQKHKLADNFSAEELAAADTLIEPQQEAELGRENLCGLPFVTIDNPSTRDMDDALYAEPQGDGWRLFVAIADPSAWITPGSALDQCALKRATSIYLPGHTVPMLPPKVSEQLCSLTAGENRLTLTCMMDISSNGTVTDYRFCPTQISSHARLNYAEVSDWIDGDPTRLGGLQPQVSASLESLKAVHYALNSNRELHAILFDERPDFRFELDEQLKLKGIHREERGSAQKLVEECMIAANLCASRFLAQQTSGLFICHPGFKSERWESVCQLVNDHLPEFDTETLKTVTGYKQLLDQIEQLEDEAPLKSILKRSLERSGLSYQLAPHYGLGFDSYTTFTSPIRKYQDLSVHRMIKAALSNKLGDWASSAPELPSQIQEATSRARRASNEVESWLCCDYIEQHKDEIFSGHIIGVIPNGFNVRLDDNGIVGFVSSKSLGKKFSFDPHYQRLHSGSTRFELDQTVRVQLAEASSPQRRIAFGLAKED